VCTLPPVLIHTSRPETKEILHIKDLFGFEKGMPKYSNGGFGLFHLLFKTTAVSMSLTDTAKYQGVKSTKPKFTSLLLLSNVQ
jgi:hypothetical protein